MACAQYRLVDGHGHARGRGVGCGWVGLGVVAQTHLVVGLQRGACRGGADVGVGVGIARQIGELARGHANGGRASAACAGREGGGVLLVACARSTGSDGHEIADSATRHVDVGQGEGGAGLRQREVDRLARAAHRARACARDFDGRRRGVGLCGVVANRDQVIGLVAGCAANVGVLVGVARRIAELARSHADGGAATGIGRGREGGGVLVVASAGAATAGDRRKVAERPADHVDVGQVEGAGVFAQGEGDRVGAAAGQAACACARHDDARGRAVSGWVGVGLRVVGDGDQVVGVF